MKTHLFHLCTLAFILVGGSLAFFNVQGYPNLQLLIGIVTAIAYIAWGIMHHAIQKDLHQKIVIEYIVMGFTAVLFLALVLR